MANPIIQRELIGTLRERRTMLMLGLLSLIFALLVALRYPTESRMALNGSRSQEVFRLFILGLLGALHLLLPVFPATSLVKERNRGTLALLLNTPLTAWQIYFGKLSASFGLAILLLFVSLPAAAACFALGGVSLTSGLGGCFLVLMLTGLELSALSLYVSSRSTSTDSAIRAAYGMILALSLISLLPYSLFVGNGGSAEMIADWMRCCSPVAAVMSLLGGADGVGRGVAETTNVPLRFAGLSLGLSALCAVATLRRLNHRIFDSGNRSSKADDWVVLVLPLIAIPLGFYLIPPEMAFARNIIMVAAVVGILVYLLRMSGKLQSGFGSSLARGYLVDPNSRSRPIGWFTNPVMVKEFRCRKYGRLHWLARLVAVCAVIALAMSILTATKTIAWDVSTIGGIMVILQIALLVLITPSLSAGLISAERESGGWTLLQMTPMSILRILWGKLLSVILTVALILCATLPGYVVMAWIDPAQRPQIERVVICLIATAGFGTLISAAVAALFRQSAVATAAAYSVLIGICVLPLLVWAGRGAPFGHTTVQTCLTINPIAATLSVIRFPGFREYDLIPIHWWVIGVLSAVSLFVLIVQVFRVSRPQ